MKLSHQEHDRLIALLMNVNYANVTDWAAGRISDQEFTLRAQANFLLCIRASLRPKFRPRVDDLLERLEPAEAEIAPAASGEGEAKPVRGRKV